MSVRLEGPRRTAFGAVSAVVRQTVRLDRSGAVIAGAGRRDPLALLAAGPRGVASFDASGRPLDLAEVERLCPGAAEATRAAAS